MSKNKKILIISTILGTTFLITNVSAMKNEPISTTTTQNDENKQKANPENENKIKEIEKFIEKQTKYINNYSEYKIENAKEDANEWPLEAVCANAKEIKEYEKDLESYIEFAKNNNIVYLKDKLMNLYKKFKYMHKYYEIIKNIANHQFDLFEDMCSTKNIRDFNEFLNNFENDLKKNKYSYEEIKEFLPFFNFDLNSTMSNDNLRNMNKLISDSKNKKFAEKICDFIKTYDSYRNIHSIDIESEINKLKNNYSYIKTLLINKKIDLKRLKERSGAEFKAKYK